MTAAAHGPSDSALEPLRAAWEPTFSADHALIDAQHAKLLVQCNLLADLCLGATGDRQADAFDQAYEHLVALVRQHVETESAVLTDRAHPDLEDHLAGFDEFEYLAAEIATTERFDRVELQRFLALWCVGHISESTRLLRG